MSPGFLKMRQCVSCIIRGYTVAAEDVEAEISAPSDKSFSRRTPEG
jgi:hypothetical protein